MTVVRLHCDSCHTTQEHDASALDLLLCTDDPSLNTYGWRCSVCGPQLKALPAYAREMLELAGANVCRWTCSEVAADLRREHASLIREFSDRLESTLETILGAA